ncbi:MAG TPA: nitroreductase family protein [Anaerolineales bacterium]|nr:nitroreductase family protein [Anaerolineales bacterium]HMX19454.1 nitroreductase family protein [Anaerolineales bacterium]HMX73891.1 nitroreductase family protein [Anaerolineales bacterium]HMZ41911.1 nitroreductase family protein [Anaerolineales bacterium]HNB86492.1 nitroreductase family protein [Anaerolineales bacterium]
MKDKSGSSSKSDQLTLTATDLHTFLRTRRSIRRFKTDPVPDTVIESILSTATFSPSAHNRQPWRFAVVTASAVKEKLADAMAVEFQRDLEADAISPENVQRKVSRSRERIVAAPVVIILSVDMTDMDTYPDTRRKKAEYIMATQSTANAGMQMLLAAHAEGLGSVWVCSPLFAQETVQNVLGLPRSWEPQAMYFLGYPSETPEVRERKSIKEIVKRVDVQKSTP